MNGEVVTALGTLVEERDLVEVDGKAVRRPAECTYLLLNKPVGVVTTMRDPQGRPTVAGFVPSHVRVVPVGRLDYATSGALLLTDDGELAHHLLHPRFGVEKTYRVEIDGHLAPQDMRRLQQGVLLDGVRTAGSKVRVVAAHRERSLLDVTIHEGRNRQIRRMFEALGHRVRALTRTRFGPLLLGRLPAGGLRPLTVRERLALERHRRPPDEAPRTKPNTGLKSSNRGTS